jgi:tetratricopeptide (TPR) repeat protein
MKKFRILLTVLIFLSCLNFQLIAKPVIQSAQNSNAEALLQAGYKLVQQEKYDEAIAVLEKVSRMLPTDYLPIALIGASYQGQMKYKSASEAYAKAIRLNPNDTKIYILKTNVDMGRNALDDAIATCRQALKIDPNFAEAYVLLARSLSAAAKPISEAIDAYQSAIKADPNFLESYVSLGIILQTAKNEKGAEEVYRKGISADPKKMTGRFQLGHLLIKQGRLVEARELWKDATSDDADELKYHLGVLASAENLKLAKDLLAKNPNDPEVLVQMGLAVLEADSGEIDGHWEAAIGYFNQALKLKPDYAKAQYGLCKAYIDFGRLFANKQKFADEELVKLRKMDKALADELEKYKNNQDRGGRGVPGGVVVSPGKLNQ